MFSVPNGNLSWTKWNLERTWFKDETHEYSWNIFMNPPFPLKHVVILWQWSREATGLYEKTCWQKQLQSSAVVGAALLRGEEDAKPIPPTRRHDTLPDGHDIPCAMLWRYDRTKVRTKRIHDMQHDQINPFQACYVFFIIFIVVLCVCVSSGGIPSSAYSYLPLS